MCYYELCVLLYTVAVLVERCDGAEATGTLLQEEEERQEGQEGKEGKEGEGKEEEEEIDLYHSYTYIADHTLMLPYYACFCNYLMMGVA